MEKERNLEEAALESLRNRIVRIFPDQIRACLDELEEEQIWWRPNEQCNSVGNLVLHLSGSLRHYLSKGVGGLDYSRDRPAEFAERGPLPKEQLVEIFDETVRQASTVLDTFDARRFLQEASEPNYYPVLFDQILGIAVHLATHAGQIVYITKMMKAGSLDELWIAAHRQVRQERA